MKSAHTHTHTHTHTHKQTVNRDYTVYKIHDSDGIGNSQLLSLGSDDILSTGEDATYTSRSRSVMFCASVPTLAESS